jgi:hypothetical protein
MDIELEGKAIKQKLGPDDAEETEQEDNIGKQEKEQQESNNDTKERGIKRK